MTGDTECFLGLDQGSGATKAVLLRSDGEVLFSTGQKIATFDLQNGRVEQDLVEIKESLESVAKEAQVFASANHLTIKSAGVALQRSGTCAWDARGVPLTPLLSWRDTRAQSTIESLRSDHERITAKTGLPVNAHYAASKWAHLRKLYPENSIHVGTLDSFLRTSWGGQPSFAVEETMAARTLLYALESGAWDQELCSLFGLPMDMLPEIVPSLSHHGTICGIPITACIGDQQAALHGRAGTLSDPMLNLGTIGSLAFSGVDRSRTPRGFIQSVLRSESIGDGRRRLFMVEGTTNSFGPLFSLLLGASAGLSTLGAIDQACARSTAPPVGFFPVGGTATPYWRSDLSCVITECGDPTQDDLVRSIVEHLAFSVASQCDMLRDAGISFGSGISVGGGYSLCDTLLHEISAATGLPLFVHSEKEVTACGAALLAAQGTGASCTVCATLRRRIDPRTTPERRLRYSRWVALRDRVLGSRLEACDSRVNPATMLHK